MLFEPELHTIVSPGQCAVAAATVLKRCEDPMALLEGVVDFAAAEDEETGGMVTVVVLGAIVFVAGAVVPAAAGAMVDELVAGAVVDGTAGAAVVLCASASGDVANANAKAAGKTRPANLSVTMLTTLLNLLPGRGNSRVFCYFRRLPRPSGRSIRQRGPPYAVSQSMASVAAHCAAGGAGLTSAPFPPWIESSWTSSQPD